MRRLPRIFIAHPAAATMLAVLLAVALATTLAPGALRAAEPAAADAAGGPPPDAAGAPARPAAPSRASLVDGFQPSLKELPDGGAGSGSASSAASFLLASPNPAHATAETWSREQAAWRAYYDYKIRGLRHRGEVYDWQLTSSKVTFVVVLFLVVAGVYFSWLQFRASLPPPPGAVAGAVARAAEGAGSEPAAVAPAVGAALAAVTEFSAGKDGIKVSSPVVGIIILVLSLLFFYLYLVYIYPISEIF